MAKTVWAIILAVVILIAAGSAYYYYTGGSIKIYATTGNLDPIYITVSSIQLHSKSGSWVTVSNQTTQVLLSSNLSFMAQARVPVGNYTEIRLQVISATVTLGGINVSATVPSYKLEVPIVPRGLNVAGGSTVYLAVIIGPHLVSTANGYILSPVITARQISSP